MAYIGKQPTVGNFVKLDTITTSATATYNLLNGGVTAAIRGGAGAHMTYLSGYKIIE